MQKYFVHWLNLDATKARPTRVFEMPTFNELTKGRSTVLGKDINFLASVTDVLCPVCETGLVRDFDAGHVPGYRVCDNPKCKRHFLARGTSENPVLILFVESKFP